MDTGAALMLLRESAGREALAIADRGPGGDAKQAEVNGRAILSVARAIGGLEAARWHELRTQAATLKAVKLNREMVAACQEAEAAAAAVATPANDQTEGTGMDERGVPTSAEELDELRRAVDAKLVRLGWRAETKSAGGPGRPDDRAAAGADVVASGPRRAAGA